jgi:hypothetical protein
LPVLKIVASAAVGATGAPAALAKAKLSPHRLSSTEKRPYVLL